MEMLDQKTEDLFALASDLGENELNELKSKDPERFNFYKTQGMISFKRKMLGLCGRKGEKSLTEIANALYELGIAASPEHGKTIVHDLNNKSMCLSYPIHVEVGFAKKYLTIEHHIHPNTDAERYRLTVKTEYDPFV